MADYDVETYYVAVASDYESDRFGDLQDCIDHAMGYGQACVVERTYQLVSEEPRWHHDHESVRCAAED